MNREGKAEIIEELKEKFATIPNFYFADASGLSVKDTNAFRRMCFEKGIEYKVVKNTFIEKALEAQETDYSAFNESVLKGFSGILFSPESGKTPATVIKDFLKIKKDGIKLKGASVDNSLYIGHDQLENLVNLKSKSELIGDLVGLLQSPMKNLLSSLQSGQNNITGVLKTLSERDAA